MRNAPKVHQEALDNTDHQPRRLQTSGRGGDLWDGRTCPPLQHIERLQSLAGSAGGHISGHVFHPRLNRARQNFTERPNKGKDVPKTSSRAATTELIKYSSGNEPTFGLVAGF